MIKKFIPPASIVFLIGLAHILSIFFSSPIISDITKPFIMPAIALYLYEAFRKLNTRWPLQLLFAILFCWFGDIALMIETGKETWFMIGIGFFLVAQIFYTSLYLKTARSRQNIRLNILYWVAYPVITGYAIMLWLKLYPGLGKMQIPVAIYTLALTAMVLAAVHRYKSTDIFSFGLVLTGACLFMISDSLIAINKFLVPLTNERIWVMTTYILAQWLIANGILKHYREISNPSS